MSAQRLKKAAAGELDLRGQLAGEYRMQRCIGRGGFGVVYEAEHPILKRKAAVKVLHASRTVDESAVRRFIAEAQTATRMRHRHIVDIFSFGTLPSGQQFYVMDFLDGVPLDRYLAEQKLLAPAVALPIMRPIAEALDALHESGIVHRDVKPANIFLAWEANGEVVPKLLDFGLVKLLSDAQAHTVSGVPMGTPYYMSPEQCLGEKVDGRADVYSFGIIYHELMSGQPPFGGETPAAVLVAHLTQPPQPLSSVNHALPAALDAPILRMLSKKADDRPATVGAASAELEQAARAVGLDIPTSPLHLPRPEAAPPERDSWFTDEAPGRSGERTTRVDKRSLLVPISLGVAVAVAGVAGAALLLGPKRASEVTPLTSASALATPEPPDPAAPVATSPSSMARAPEAASATASAAPVAVTVRGAPAGASVLLGDDELGKAPGPVLLPFGKEPVSLKVVAPGYEPKLVSVVPVSSAEVRVTLTKSARSGKRAAVPGDLENPF